MRRIAECHAEQASGNADHDELECEQPEDVGLRQPEAAHHRARIQMTLREPARCGRNGHRGDHRREQRDQREKALRTFQRPLHFRTPTLERLEPLPALQVAFDRSFKRLHRRSLARGEQAIGGPAADGNQLGRRQVGQVDHDARRKVDEAGTAVRLDRDDAIDPEDLLAELEVAARRRSDRLQQLRVDPRRSGRRYLPGRFVGASRFTRKLHRAAQRIAR